jgi:aminopeptidase N
VRPSSYIAIDNFYTATVYEKGAELIGVLRTLVGEAAFRRGCNLYFTRLDGLAATMEQFVDCFAEASGQDLSGFLRWYEQPGTPTVRLEHAYDLEARALKLTLSQSAPAGRETGFRPVPIPVRLGLLDADGAPLTFTVGGSAVREHTAVLVDDRLELGVEGVERPPMVSALRGFSAPVQLRSPPSGDDRYVLLAADPDLFNRWEAGQQLAAELILARAAGDGDPAGERRYAEAVCRALNDQQAEPALKALLLAPPSEGDLSLMRTPYDPQRVRQARESLRAVLGEALRQPLEALHDALDSWGPFSPDPESAGRRALRNTALHLLISAGGAEARAQRHYREAANMTDSLSGLDALAVIGGEPFETALADFYTRWAHEPLVVDKWFAVQARSPEAGVLGRVMGLTAHPAFDRRDPNRLRALVQTFSANLAAFHAPDGSGHRFLVDQIIGVDALNPKTAARLVEPLGGWRRLLPEVGASARRELERLLATPGLSDNVRELADKALT